MRFSSRLVYRSICLPVNFSVIESKAGPTISQIGTKLIQFQHISTDRGMALFNRLIQSSRGRLLWKLQDNVMWLTRAKPDDNFFLSFQASENPLKVWR